MNETWIEIGTHNGTPVLVNPKSSQYRLGASHPSTNLLTHFMQGLNGKPLLVKNAAALAEHFIARSLPAHFKWQDKIIFPNEKIRSEFLQHCENRLNAIKKKQQTSAEDRERCLALSHTVKKLCK